jgi:hypothetical protein
MGRVARLDAVQHQTTTMKQRSRWVVAVKAKRPHDSRRERGSSMRASPILVAVLLLLGAGCATTVQRTAEPSPAICGFLGADLCAELQPGAKGEAGLRYVNPKGTLTQYDKVMIVMVSFFGSDPGKIKPQDEHRLTDLFYKNLHDALGKRYRVVDEAGPGVMKVEVVLLDAEAATPGVRSLTMAVPQLRVLSAGYALAAGTYPFAGGGQAAVKITDSVSEDILGLAVDRRAGGGAIQTAAQWRWGDAENAIKTWSSQLADGMYAYTSGEKKP